jgi:hypothetical protein
LQVQGELVRIPRIELLKVALLNLSLQQLLIFCVSEEASIIVTSDDVILTLPSTSMTCTNLHGTTAIKLQSGDLNQDQNRSKIVGAVSVFFEDDEVGISNRVSDLRSTLSKSGFSL